MRAVYAVPLRCIGFVAGCLLVSLAAPAQQPDTIYYNAHVITVSQSRPSAQAIAIRGDRFAAIGGNDEVLKTAGPQTRKVDLAGKCIVPGIIESHVHPIGAALSEIDGPVPLLHSIPEIQAYVREQASKLPVGRLIFVPKVYSTRLKERRYPNRYEVDAAAPGREAMLDNGYAAVLNSTLLRKAGITRDTPQPANGRIERDAQGEPTGLILGAPQLLRPLRAARPYSDKDRLWALKSILQRYNSVGITSIYDRSEGPEGFRAYQALYKAGELTARSTVTYLISAGGSPAEVRQEIERIPFVTGWGDEWLRVGTLKAVVDGGILIGTALLREPYGRHTEIYGFSDPEYRGVLSVPRENLFEMAKTANELGWQMTAHTTGGGATDLLLDAYEAADRIASIKDRRFTVTHGNFPNAAAIARAKRLGVLFDVQPFWLYLDGPAIKDVFGPDRMKDFQPLRSLIDAGVVVGGGSDHMIRFDPREATNPYHPFLGMWIAVTRKTVDGTVLNPEQRISRMEALKMWTWNGAYLMFAEKDRGSIEPGKLADLVILSKDYETCPEDEIKEIEALRTIVGAKIVYDRLR
ncbi:MAG TPA: amidohydrolase [Candidatus Acidoferrales bacterium]|nr:amidohydrolase [Candidatus Acidoferrales bacterium]